MSIFQPYRAVGMVASETPFVLNYQGDATFVVVSIGMAYHVYRTSDLSLVFVSPQLPTKLSAVAVWHDVTFCASEHNIFVVHRTKLVKTLKGHSGNIVALLILGDFLLSLCQDGMMKTWSMMNRMGTDTEEVATIDLKVLQDVSTPFLPTAILHPDTYLNKVIVASSSGHLDLWNIRSQKRVYRFDSFAGKPITCLAQSSVVDVVGIGCADGNIFVHNLRFDETLMHFCMTGQTIQTMSFRLGGQVGGTTSTSRKATELLATADSSGTVALWDLNKKKIHSTLKRAHSLSVASLAFLRNEPLLLTSSMDNSLKLWIFDKADGSARLLKSREGHVRPPTQVRFYGGSTDEAVSNSVDGSMLQILSAGQDSTFRVFHATRDAQSCELSQGSLQKVAHTTQRNIQSMKLSPIRSFAASEVRGGDFANIVTCHENDVSAYTWSFKKKTMSDFALTPPEDGNTGNFVDYHAVKKRKRGTFVQKNLGSILPKSKTSAVTLSACGNFALLGSCNGEIYKFSMQSGMPRGRYPKNTPCDSHGASVTAMAIDGTNKKVVSTSLDATLKIWDFQSHELLHSVAVESPVTHAVLHRDSNLFSMACDSCSILVYDIFSNPPRLVRSFKGHSRYITDVAITPNGRWLLSSSVDCSFRVWDIVSAACISWSKFSKPITSMSLSPSGEFLATTHVEDQGIYLWANRGHFETLMLEHNPKTPLRVRLPTSLPSTQCATAKLDDEEPIAVSESPEDELDSPMVFEDVGLAPNIATLSRLPRSQWQNLSKLELIKERNKPTEAPKAPVLAPFFIPSRSTLDNPAFMDDAEAKEEGIDRPTSKILSVGGSRHLTTLMKLLVVKDGQPCQTQTMRYLKTLSTSMIDLEFRSICFGDEDDVGKAHLERMLSVFKCEVLNRCDYQVIQSYLNLFLTLHLDTIVQDEELVSRLKELEECQRASWKDVHGWMQNASCLVEHFLGIH